MTSNKFGYYQSQYEVVFRFNNWGPKTKRAIKSLGCILELIAVIAIIILLWPLYEKLEATIRAGYSLYSLLWLLLYIPLFIALPFVHEPIHCIPLWFFSKQRPQITFQSPHHPYVKLRSNTSVSRIEGLISYLLPFMVITTVCIIIAFFVNPIVQIALFLLALSHAPGCDSDFLSSFWLWRCAGDNIRLAHEDSEVGFDTVFFRDKRNT